MALITKVSNLLEKNKDKPEIQEYLSTIPEWQDYVQGELKKSNENNDKSLGGQQPKQAMGDEDEGDNNYEVNMDKIMARFSNFNSIVSSNSKDDDEDEEEEEKKEDILNQNEQENTQDENKGGSSDDIFKDLP